MKFYILYDFSFSFFSFLAEPYYGYGGYYGRGYGYGGYRGYGGYGYGRYYGWKVLSRSSHSKLKNNR